MYTYIYITHIQPAYATQKVFEQYIHLNLWNHQKFPCNPCVSRADAAKILRVRMVTEVDIPNFSWSSCHGRFFGANHTH